jgi:hypothetical protein
MKFKALFTTVCACLSFFVLANVRAEANVMTAVVESVKNVCQFPSDQGSHWTVTIRGDGNARVKLIGVSGEAEFSKSEWSGVQQVLREHQARDSRSYRDCARALTPLFLDRFTSSSLGEPTRNEMQEALTAKIASVNREINQLVEKCKQGGFGGDDPFRAFQCLQSVGFMVASPKDGELSFQVERLEKLGCAPAVGQPGFICDYVVSMSGNSPYFRGALGEILADGNVGQGRFLKQGDQWTVLPLQYSGR